jgi:hypothetical protein
MELINAELISILSEAGFPFAFMIVSLLALGKVTPILKNSFDRQEDLFERIADTQDQIAETLNSQRVLLHTLEQRVTRIENRLGSNTRRDDKG